jgi:hypothetical protein
MSTGSLVSQALAAWTSPWHCAARAAAIAAVLALAACSGGNSSSSEDASLGPGQPLGAACNASLTNPCVAPLSGCTVNQCASGVCVEYIVDAGGSCAVADGALPPINGLCVTNSDCDGGLCGYLAAGGCSITGVCFPASASNGVLPPPACGCNGLPDPYVTSDFTGTPAASPAPCADGGPDASVDSGVDAAGADASDGAPE